MAIGNRCGHSIGRQLAPNRGATLEIERTSRFQQPSSPRGQNDWLLSVDPAALITPNDVIGTRLRFSDLAFEGALALIAGPINHNFILSLVNGLS